MRARVAAAATDVFGIVELYPTAPGGMVWTSQHWANGRARYIQGRDPDDPTGASENRSDQAQLFVNGKGVLKFLGGGAASEPRLHLNGGSAFSFKNVEITFYYKRKSDADVDWGGLVVGARSGPEGHSKSPSFCDAHTYYGRIRNDGKWDFEKELKHPASSTRNGPNVWNGSTSLPPGWIGMKYVVYNTKIAGRKGVKLELYRDLSGGRNGGAWEKLGETIDDGGWVPPQSGGACAGLAPDYVPTRGGGVIVLRNTGSIKDNYRWMTVREIIPPR